MRDLQDTRHLDYRPDIDGLRAVAVLGVLAYHYSPKTFKGGFVGVDVFFVISGFLITRLIIRHLGDGDFSFAGFYSRRIRRIFPALALVLLTTLVFGWFFVFPPDLGQAGKHIAAGAAFASNFVLWGESGYFDAATETKPLLHLWSLAIEEQFYVFWPLILWGGWKISRKPWQLIALLFASSFALDVALSRAGVPDAFYSPASRAWELLSGAALASARLSTAEKPHPWFAKTPDLRSMLGASLLIAGFILIDAGRRFPGWWALLPTIGATLIVSAGPQALVNRYVLSSRPLVKIGLISYPLYLWHWPLLVFTRLTVDSIPSRSQRAALLVASLALAWCTYQFIEKPVLFSSGHRRHRTAPALIGLMVVVGIAGWICFANNGFPNRFPPAIRHIVDIHLPAVEWREGSCFLRPEQDASSFTACPEERVTHKPVLLLWGDSTAAQLYPGYRAYFPQYNIVQRTASGCRPILDVTFANQPRCRGINDAIFGSLARMRPARIVLAGRWSTIDWRKVENTVRALGSIAPVQIDLIGPEPEWSKPLPRQLYTYFSSHGSRQMPARLSDANSPDMRDLDAAMADFAGGLDVHYISTRAILCNEDGCISQIGGEPTALDMFHLSVPASLFVVSHFAGAQAAH